MSVQSGLIVWNNYRYLFSQRRGERRENCVVCSPDAVSKYPRHVMSCSLFISFRRRTGPPSPQLFPGRRGVNIVFVFPCPSLLVPLTCKYSLRPLRLSERKKTNIISQRRRARRGVWGKNKTNIEVPNGLGAFAREKHKISRQGAKHAKVFRVKTN